jgi:hypothetical protein
MGENTMTTAEVVDPCVVCGMFPTIPIILKGKTYCGGCEQSLPPKIKRKKKEQAPFEKTKPTDPMWLALSNMRKELDELKNSQEATIKLIRTDVNNLLKSGDFYQGLKKHLIKIIVEEVRVQINNSDIMTYIRKMAQSSSEQYIKTHMRDFIQTVVNSVLDKQLKRYRFEFEQAKKLAYSINTVVKHELMKSPISLNFEQQIMGRITQDLQQISAKATLLQLEETK